jgi:hypothetical protein
MVTIGVESMETSSKERGPKINGGLIHDNVVRRDWICQCARTLRSVT